jgi:hypothetical protein
VYRIDVWLYQPINICLYWRIIVCMYRLEYMYQCIRINPTVIGKEGKNKKYFRAKNVYQCMTVWAYKYIFVLAYLCVYVSAWIYVSVYKNPSYWNQSYCNRQRMYGQNTSSELNMCFEAKNRFSFCFALKQKYLIWSEAKNWKRKKAKRSEKIKLNFSSEQAKHKWNGSNFASFRL